MKVMQLTVGVVGTNCYIVYDEATREAAVIDPGDNAKSILHAVAEEKLTVRYVLLTHAHFDHILAVHDVLEATGAQFVCPEADTWLLSRDNMGQFRSLARSYVQDTPDILAGEGTAVTFGGLTAVYMSTPGHTPGSSVIKIGDCLFTGDTLFRGSIGTTMFGGSDREMHDTLEALYRYPGDYGIYPGHGESTSLSDEKRDNPFFGPFRGN